MLMFKHEKKKYYCRFCSREERISNSTYILVPCAGKCGKRAQVPRSSYDENKEYYCSVCQRIGRSREKGKYINYRGSDAYIQWWIKHG